MNTLPPRLGLIVLLFSIIACETTQTEKQVVSTTDVSSLENKSANNSPVVVSSSDDVSSELRDESIDNRGDPITLSASPLLIDISAVDSETSIPEGIDDSVDAVIDSVAMKDEQILSDDPPAKWLQPPDELRKDFEFWVKIYSEVTTKQGLIHDDRRLDVIYEKVDLPKNKSRRSTRAFIRKRKQVYINILNKLSRGETTNLSKQEQRVAALWKGSSRKELKRAMSRLRFQLGQRDRFLQGYIRSGTWESYITKVFSDMGLPNALVLLPHVESSFNPDAYSKVGAAGMWQFTRSTGRRFMRIDHVIDERMDPYKATVAAAKLLKSNFSQLNSWPLTLTSYNHGVGGMKRAIRKTGGTDIVKINRTYRGRTFGFASRNFYLSFIAASYVHNNASEIFGDIERNQPLNYDRITTPAFVSAATLSRVFGVKQSVLRSYNPALREPIFNGSKYIPKSYELRLPKAKIAQPMVKAINSIEPKECFFVQQPDLSYRVRRGDTLSAIANRFKVSEMELVLMNGLRSRHRIRIGQRLLLPKPRTAQLMTAKSSKSNVQFADGCRAI